VFDILVTTINQILTRFRQQTIRDPSLRQIFYLNTLASILDIVNSWVQINFGGVLSTDNQTSLTKLISDIQKDLLELSEWISNRPPTTDNIRSRISIDNSVSNEKVYKV
jgi:hypothetical protein